MNIQKSILSTFFFIFLQLLYSGPASAADWYVRLTVTALDDPAPVRMDDGNVFGRLHDSLDGQP
ncbi:MAG: hypothetical protein D3921_12365 [Candidatus Electrothrix sp. AW1]|nr:hypothetical protein [Candidatus Electrothrix gigas]